MAKSDEETKKEVEEVKEEGVDVQAVATSLEFDDTGFWDGVVGQLDSGGSNFLFFKEGKTRIKLLAPPNAKHPRDLFAEVHQSFRGQKPRSKFAFYCFLLEDLKDEEITDDQLIRIAIAPKSVFKGLAAMMSEGYNFFHPVTGQGITIIRNGTGLSSSYNPVPSPKAVPAPQRVLELMEGRTIEDAVKAWTKFQDQRSANEVVAEDAEETDATPEDEKALNEAW